MERNLRAMASTLEAMASNLIVMASDLSGSPSPEDLRIHGIGKAVVVVSLSSSSRLIAAQACEQDHVEALYTAAEWFWDSPFGLEERVEKPS